MFERYFADTLSRLLGDIVEDLDATQLRTNVWQGTVQLRDLQVKRSVLDHLELPLRIHRGTIGFLDIKVPWARLKSAPVELELSHVHVILRAVDEAEAAAGGQERSERQEAEKRRKLANLFAMPQEEASSSWTSRLQMTIARNLRLTLNNVHVTVESAVDPETPHSFGVALESFSIHTTDANWDAAFVAAQGAVDDADATVSYKKLRASNFFVYWNSRAALLLDSDSEQASYEKMEAIFDGHNYIGHTYIGHNYICHTYMDHNYIGELRENGGDIRRRRAGWHRVPA